MSMIEIDCNTKTIHKASRLREDTLVVDHFVVCTKFQNIQQSAEDTINASQGSQEQAY